MTGHIAPDPDMADLVRLTFAMQKGKTDGERQAFNEGVMAATNTLAAFIDGEHPEPIPPSASRVLERAYRTMMGAKLRVSLSASVDGSGEAGETREAGLDPKDESAVPPGEAADAQKEPQS